MSRIEGNDKDNKYVGESDVFENPVNEIYGYGGDDSLEGGFFAENWLLGGDGNDTLQAFGPGENWFYGEDGDDVLSARGGHLDGGKGADTLTSMDSAHLDGGRGADLLIGGDGADTFVIDSARDVIVESYVPEFDNEPNPRDKVISSVDFKLSATLECLELAGKKDISGFGNDDDNALRGNAGRNLLDAGKGDDTLIGGGGDTLTGGNGEDYFLFLEIPKNGEIALISDFDGRTDRIGINYLLFEDGTVEKGDWRYDKASRSLFVDVDGKGGEDAVKVAEFEGAVSIKARHVMLDIDPLAW